MSSLTYANQHDLGVFLLSFDYFKAYDRVLLSFLLVVMKRMGISTQFCCWIENTLPLTYVQTVREIKVFGIILMNSFKHILTRNWEVKHEIFERLLMSWQ